MSEGEEVKATLINEEATKDEIESSIGHYNDQYISSELVKDVIQERENIEDKVLKISRIDSNENNHIENKSIKLCYNCNSLEYKHHKFELIFFRKIPLLLKPLVPCISCKYSFHLDCLNSTKNYSDGILWGDNCFVIICENCVRNKEKGEIIFRFRLDWKDLVHLSLFNLVHLSANLRKPYSSIKRLYKNELDGCRKIKKCPSSRESSPINKISPINRKDMKFHYVFEIAKFLASKWSHFFILPDYVYNSDLLAGSNLDVSKGLNETTLLNYLPKDWNEKIMKVLQTFTDIFKISSTQSNDISAPIYDTHFWSLLKPDSNKPIFNILTHIPENIDISNFTDILYLVDSNGILKPIGIDFNEELKSFFEKTVSKIQKPIEKQPFDLFVELKYEKLNKKSKFTKPKTALTFEDKNVIYNGFKIIPPSIVRTLTHSKNKDYTILYPDLPNYISPNVVIYDKPTHCASQIIVENENIVTNSRGHRMAKSSHGVDYGCYYYEFIMLKSTKENSFTELINLNPDVQYYKKIKYTSRTSTCYNPMIRIGWSQISADLHASIGFDEFSVGYRLNPLSRYHNKEVMKIDTPDTPEFGYLIYLFLGESDVGGMLIYLPKPSDIEFLDLLSRRWVVGTPYIPFTYRVPAEFDNTDIELPILRKSSFALFINGKLIDSCNESLLLGKYYPTVSVYNGAKVEFNFGPTFLFPPTDNFKIDEDLYVPIFPISHLSTGSMDPLLDIL